MAYFSSSPDNFGFNDSDNLYDFGTGLEDILSNCQTPADTHCYTPHEVYMDCTDYTAKTLMDLEPCRPGYSTPPTYAKMNPVLCPGQLDVPHDDVAVVPYGLSPDHEGTPSPAENMCEYNNLSAITPTVMDLRRDSVYYNEEVLRGGSYASSSSPASSSTSTTSWLQSTQVADDSRNEVSSNNPVGEYINLSAITPTVMDLRRDPVYYNEEVLRGGSYASSSSPASSSTSTTSWQQSTQVADDSRNEVSSNNPAAVTSPGFSLATAIMQCVKCGTRACELGHWRQDSSGNLLCSNCWRSTVFNSLAPENTTRPKPAKKMSLQAISVLDRLTPSYMSTRAHRSNNTRKANQTCSNCQTEKTSLWRRSKGGETVCNACGLYYNLHKEPRPLSMRKDTIQKRKRKPKSSPKTIIERPKFQENGINHQATASLASSSPPSYPCHVSVINGMGNYYDSSPSHPLPPMDSLDGFSNQLPQYSHFPLLHHPSIMTPAPLPPGIPMTPVAESYNSISTAIAKSELPSYESSMMSIAPSISSSSPSSSCSLASLLQTPPLYRRFGDSPY